jgi:hypothetical protein
MFDSFRQSLEDLMNRATPPEERREITARMRATLVQAKAAVHEMRDALEKTRGRLTLEERELETIRRRKQLAEGIGDKETVEIATRYEQVHSERAEIVRRKVDAQQAELSLAEREVETMSSELKSVMAGAGASSSSASIDPGPSAEGDGSSGALHEEFDTLRRSRERSQREADADRRLEELKRKMGGGGGDGRAGGS